jgi:hypothetical protein
MSGNGENGVQKFTNNGTFIRTWGANRLGDGQFINPSGIGIDSAGNVADFGENNNIQKFDSSGKFITKWGTPGSGDGQLGGPIDIALDSKGLVYVVDGPNHRIQVFGLSSP